MGAESAPFILSRVKNEEINRENFCPEDISNIGDAGLKEFYFKQVSRSVLERIVNFGTNRIPNTYSIVRIERTEYQVITCSQKTIRVVFEYLKLFE